MRSGENFWTRDSYMTISQEGGIMIGRYTLDKYYRREFKFQPHSVLEKGSSWKYSSTYAENYAAWSSGSYFPVANMDVITRYYRKTVSFGDLTGFTSFELAVNTNYDIAMYVNGQEIYRHNLAADASDSTPVEEAETEAYYHRAFANRQSRLCWLWRFTSLRTTRPLWIRSTRS